MQQYIELKLLGITYNQIESGVYALILEEPLSKKRIPIVIGHPEAQSIECRLQGVKTPRPLSHDVMGALIHSLNATLDYIYIHQLPSGVFAANLELTNEIGHKIRIDSRSSDAIALAIRMNAPIYTSFELVEKVGLSPDANTATKRPRPQGRMGKQPGKTEKTKTDDLSGLDMEELNRRLEKYVGEERYEEAARIKAELERRGFKA